MVLTIINISIFIIHNKANTCIQVKITANSCSNTPNILGTIDQENEVGANQYSTLYKVQNKVVSKRTAMEISLANIPHYIQN